MYCTRGPRKDDIHMSIWYLCISSHALWAMQRSPTFQRCTLSIFSDMTGDILEIFMDDLSLFGSTFDTCLDNLSRVLIRCKEKNLLLNWEKCHFMVQRGIVLGRIISKDGIQ